MLNECFYEKVIKVKADVAALLILFSEMQRRPVVTCGAVKGEAKAGSLERVRWGYPGAALPKLNNPFMVPTLFFSIT
jgi:hypothetical protein